MNGLILIVEDLENDIILLKFALETIGFTHPPAIARDGRQAIQYLRAAASSSGPLIPKVVLLDIRLPIISGLEVLKWIRSRPQPHFKDLPVIMFSSSDLDVDVNTAYALGATGYIRKPAFDELLKTLRLLKKYWLDMDRPPPDCQEWHSLNIQPSPPRPLRDKDV